MFSRGKRHRSKDIIRRHNIIFFLIAVGKPQHSIPRYSFRVKTKSAASFKSAFISISSVERSITWTDPFGLDEVGAGLGEASKKTFTDWKFRVAKFSENLLGIGRLFPVPDQLVSLKLSLPSDSRESRFFHPIGHTYNVAKRSSGA